jgi:multidrug resistance efflux pump
MISGGDDMAKNRLRNAAVKIGSAVGRIDGAAHKAALRAAKAAHVARQELIDLEKQVDALKKQLQKSTKRLRSALK